MARGDVKSTRSSGRGYGGGGSQSYYDDEGRGRSKSIWEWFSSNYERSGYSRDFLMSRSDQDYYSLIKSSTDRFGLMDIAYYSRHDLDSRARRLVIQKDRGKEKTWVEFHAAMVAGYDRHREQLEKQHKEASERRDAEYAVYRAQREAEVARIEREDWEKVQPMVEMTRGMLQSDFNQAFQNVERNGTDSGDWIDNPVSLFIDGSGYGYDDQKAVGLKLQITLSLDLSNSMYYNGIADEAAATFRDLGMTLRQMKYEYQDDLYVGFFTFGEDYSDQRGKHARNLSVGREPRGEHDFMEFGHFRPSELETSWGMRSLFSGEDTYFTPLFQAIERWEKENSDPGAMKLDVVITDYVQEHPRDIRESDVIQERRDGSLQTVMLNFMPEADWHNATLPRRCFMVAVDKDNIAGILRNVLSEFVGMSV